MLKKFRLVLPFACVSMAFALAACGGGSADEPAQAPGLQSHTAVAEAYAASPGYRLKVTAQAETLGPSVEAMTWSAEPLHDAQGAIQFGDMKCADATQSIRAIPNDSTKVRDLVTCNTYLVGSEGASGQFEVKSLVTLSNGSTHSTGFTVSIN